MPLVHAQTFSGTRTGFQGRRAPREGRPRRFSRRGDAGRAQPQAQAQPPASRPQSAPSRYTPPASRATAPRRWSGHLALGPNVRVQAAEGYRAVVQEISPGLFLVAETPSQQVTEFGSVVLAPLLIKAATTALQNPEKTAQAARKVVNAGKGALQAGKGAIQRLKSGGGEAQAAQLAEPKPARQLPAPATAQPVPVYEEDDDYIDAELLDEEAFAGLIPPPRPSHMARWLSPAMVAGFFGGRR